MSFFLCVCSGYHMFSVAHAILSGLIFATEGGRVLKFFEATVFGCNYN